MKRSSISKNGSTGIATFFKSPVLPVSMSPRSFIHYLNALWVNTEVMLMNTSHFYLLVSSATSETDEKRYEKLSRFQRALAMQIVELQRHIISLDGDPVPRDQWVTYADLWSIQECNSLPSAWLSLHENANLLADLYESALVLSMQQPSRSDSLYLFAHHLIEINSFLTGPVKANVRN